MGNTTAEFIAIVAGSLSLLLLMAALSWNVFSWADNVGLPKCETGETIIYEDKGWECVPFALLAGEAECP